MIDRRTAVAGIVAMFGAGLFAPIARAAAGQVVPISEGPPSAPVFNAEQRALMTALSERIIPTTDTPGAIAAGVPEYIEKLLADWSLPEDRKPVIAGLDAIGARAMADYKVAGSKATPAQHDALLTLAMNNQIPEGQTFFEMLRQLVIFGYYTSEVGITQEREYLPVPGQYDGAFLYSNINKVYSA